MRSIGDTDLSQLFSPAITALTWELDAVGLAAAQLLLKQIGRADPTTATEPERVLLTTQSVLRESCGPLAWRVAKATKPARVRL